MLGQHILLPCGDCMSSAGVGGLSASHDGFSTCNVEPHMLPQCLSQLLGSAPWWSTAPEIS